MMTKWWNDPVQRAKFKRNYNRNGQAERHNPLFINDEPVMTGDVSYIVVPQFAGMQSAAAGKEARWFSDNFAVVLASTQNSRDPRGELSVEEEFRRAIRTPEVRYLPKDHKLCVVCGDTQPRSEFWPKADAKDGLDPRCKRCKRAYNAQLQWEAREVERLQKQADGRYRKPGRPTKAA